jgi:hypothetical protein
MILRMTLLAAIVCGVSACTTLTDEQKDFVTEARKIRSLPIERSELVKALQLDAVESKRTGGYRGINNTVEFREAWKHPNGLTIDTYIGERAKRAFNPLNPLERVPFPKRPKYQVFNISLGSKVLYRSYELQDG